MSRYDGRSSLEKVMLSLFAILVSVILATGCAQKEKVVGVYNFTDDINPNNNVTIIKLPDNLTSVKIEYKNLKQAGFQIRYNTYSNKPRITFYTLSTVLPENSRISDFMSKVIDTKYIDIEDKETKSGTVELKAKGAKSLVIINYVTKGSLKVIAV